MWSLGYVQLSKVTNPPTFCSRFPSMLDDVTLLLSCFKFHGPRRHDSNLQVSTQKHKKNTPRQQSPLHLFGQSHDQKAKPSNGGSETPSHSPQLGERSDMTNPKGVNLQNAYGIVEVTNWTWRVSPSKWVEIVSRGFASMLMSCSSATLSSSENNWRASATLISCGRAKAAGTA